MRNNPYLGLILYWIRLRIYKLLSCDIIFWMIKIPLPYINTFFFNRVRTLFFLLFFISFAFRQVNDPDFGWHLRTGEYIVKHGWVPTHDIFSYTMPAYQWIHNTALSDVIFYALFTLGGNTTFLLSLFFFTLAYLIFIVLLPKTHVLPKEEINETASRSSLENRIAVGVLGLSTVIFYSNALIFDYLGFVLILMILERYKVQGQQRLLWFLPPIFFLWPYLHQGFSMGFMLVGVYFFADTLEVLKISLEKFKDLKKVLLFPLGITLLSVLVTFLNPDGWKIYRTAYELWSSQSLSAIAYWTPTALSVSTYSIFIYFLLFFMFLIFAGFRPPLRQFLSIFFFASLGFIAMRLSAFFILASIPVILELDKKKHIYVLQIIFIIFLIALQLVIARGVFTQPLFVPKKQSFSEFFEKKDIFWSEAPAEAVNYIKNNIPEGNMFNEYDWGGTLAWALPTQKLFINGNMVYWKNEQNREIFKDFLIIKQMQEGWQERLQYYKVDWFLIETNSPLAAGLLLMPNEWKRVYRDNRASVFIKK